MPTISVPLQSSTSQLT